MPLLFAFQTGGLNINKINDRYARDKVRKLNDKYVKQI